MTSIKQQIGGYLKQLIGEIVGNQPLHESGKHQVVGASAEEQGEPSAPSNTDPAAADEDGTSPSAPTPLVPSGNKAGPPEQEKSMSVYTQLLPEIENGSGPYVKVTSEDTVIYVATDSDDPFDHAKEAIVRMAETLTAKPEKATAPDDAESEGEYRSDRGATGNDDLDDQLDIGLEDSFPASDPPAVATSTVLPKKQRK